MKKETRSNKWAFEIYEDSAPKDYQERLTRLGIPWIFSPWHDKDVNSETGELKKKHRHGAFFFDSLKSYSQVSEIVSEVLNGPSHVEVIMSPTGMYDYFTHAQNPDKTPYDINDIESGSGFDLAGFLLNQNSKELTGELLEVIKDKDFKEFYQLVDYLSKNDDRLLSLVVQKSFFFSKYLDSARYHASELSQSKENENQFDKENE